MTIDKYIGYLGALVLGAYGTYLYMLIDKIRIETRDKLFLLERTIRSELENRLLSLDAQIKKIDELIAEFPTVEEIAREVMSMKIPISSLPKSTQDAIGRALGEMKRQDTKKNKKDSDLPFTTKTDEDTYIG